ncbi:hypothetical protein IGI04_019205, partial [Brassica rapa subsp. trilocularis]
LTILKKELTTKNNQKRRKEFVASLQLSHKTSTKQKVEPSPFKSCRRSYPTPTTSPPSQPPITFTPTIQHCRMASIIGLCLRAKLKECLPLHYQVNYALKVYPGSHADEQLNDKERLGSCIGES